MSEINFDPVNLTQSLVKCASVTPKDEGALTVVENHLSAIGCDCHPLIFSGNNSYEVKNLFATIGNEGKHFAYAGHTDVVPVGNESSWKYPPFSAKIDEGKLYGRGSEDMKSSVACFISAAKRFVDKYKNIPGKISFIITGDEERDSVNGTPRILEWASKQNYKFDHCLVGEPTSKNEVGDKVKIGRRGSVSFFFQVIKNDFNIIDLIVFSKLENASCTYTYDATAESFLNKAGDLYNIISKSISDVTGRNSPPEQATDGGTSDARYIKNYCEVVELGLRNQTLHKVDEFVFVEDIIKLENIYFRILENYFDVN